MYRLSTCHSRLLAGSGDYSLRLEVTPRKPLVLHGDEGLSQKGQSEGNASYYYSFPRLDTSGVITVAGVEYPVHGSSWIFRVPTVINLLTTMTTF